MFRFTQQQGLESMEGADILKPPRALLARGPTPTVYWDSSFTVGAVSLMMVAFICSAIAFLSYKVWVQDEDCDETSYDVELHESDRAAPPRIASESRGGA